MDHAYSAQNPLTSPSQTTVPLHTTPPAPSITLSTSDPQEGDGNKSYWEDTLRQEELENPGLLESHALSISNTKIDVKQQLIEIIKTLGGVPVDVGEKDARSIGSAVLKEYRRICGEDQVHEILTATREAICSEAASKLRRIESLANYLLFGCLYADCAILNSQDMTVKMQGSARTALWIKSYQEGVHIMIELALQAQEAWGGDIGMLKTCFRRMLGRLPRDSKRPEICLKSIPAIQELINDLATCFLEHKQALAELRHSDENTRERIYEVWGRMLPFLVDINDAEKCSNLLNKVIKNIKGFFIHAEALVRLELASLPIALKITSHIFWVVRKRRRSYQNFPIHLPKLLSDAVQPCQWELARFVAKCDEENFGSLLNAILHIYGLYRSASNANAMTEVFVQLLSIDQTGYFCPNDIIKLFDFIFNYDHYTMLKTKLKKNPKFDLYSNMRHVLTLFISCCRNIIEKYKIEMRPYLIVSSDLGLQIVEFLRQRNIKHRDDHCLSNLEHDLSDRFDAIKKICIQLECFLIQAFRVDKHIQNCMMSNTLDSSMKEQIIQETFRDYRMRNCIFKGWAEKLTLEPEELRNLLIKWDSSILQMTSYFEKMRSVSRMDQEHCRALLRFVYLLNHQFGCSLDKVEEHLLNFVYPIIFRLRKPSISCSSIDVWLTYVWFYQHKRRSNDVEDPVTRSGGEDIKLFDKVVDFLSQEDGETAQLLKCVFVECPSQVWWILNVTAFESRKCNVSVEQEFAAWEAEARARIKRVIKIYNITQGSVIECIDLAQKVTDKVEEARKAILEMDTTSEGASNRIVENLETVLTDSEIELPRSVAALRFLLLETGYCTLPNKEWQLAVQEYVKFVTKIELGTFGVDAAYSGVIESYLRHVVTIMPLDEIRAFGDDEIEACFDGFLNANASFKKLYQYGKLLDLKIKEAIAKKRSSETMWYERLYQCLYLFDERIMALLVPLLRSESQEDQEKADQFLERVVAIHAADSDQRSLMLSADFLLHFLNHFEEVQSCLSQVSCESIRAFEGYVQPVEGQVRALSTIVFFILVDKHFKFTDAQKGKFIVEGIRKTARLKGMKKSI